MDAGGSRVWMNIIDNAIDAVMDRFVIIRLQSEVTLRPPSH